MLRLTLFLLIAGILSGCATLEPKQILAQSKDWLEKTGNRLYQTTAPATSAEEYDAEVQALFEQSYIDPLTDYLNQYSDDEARAMPLREVSAERRARCQKIAEKYTQRPLNQQSLDRYQSGYHYSCPNDVKAFAEQLAFATIAERATELEKQESPSDTSLQQAALAEIAPEIVTNVNKDQISECYLLTTISNFREAKQVCKNPAEEGDVRSQLNMALIHKALSEYTQALQWAQTVEKDSPRARYLIGELYAEGSGVKQNDQQAFSWYLKAAEQAYPESQYKTAHYYEFGRGVSQDSQRAIEWYRRAALNSNVAAQHALGEILLQSKNVPASAEQGQHWLVQAARAGSAQSSVLLGRWHQQQPDSLNQAKAIIWYELAEQQGASGVANRTVALRKKVDDTSLELARSEIQSILNAAS